MKEACLFCKKEIKRIDDFKGVVVGERDVWHCSECGTLTITRGKNRNSYSNRAIEIIDELQTDAE